MLFTFPSRYSFAIGQTGIFRLTPRSVRIHTGFHESRATRERPQAGHALTATGPSPSTARHSILFASHAALSLPPGSPAPGRNVPQHPYRNPRRVSHGKGLAIIRFRSPLLTEYLFLQVLRCFTSLRTPRSKTVPAHDGRRVTPFGNPRIKALSAAPRGLSQPHTPFIGPVCQGIHHTPLPTTRPPRANPRDHDAAHSLPDDTSTQSRSQKHIKRSTRPLNNRGPAKNMQQPRPANGQP